MLSAILKKLTEEPSMQKKFELWLDESGNFMNEAELKKQKKNPSLIGGILLEKEYADSIDLDDFIDNEHNHAMHFTDEQKEHTLYLYLND